MDMLLTIGLGILFIMVVEEVVRRSRKARHLKRSIKYLEVRYGRR